MNYIIKGHQYSEELVSAVMLFYPNEKFTPVENTGEGLTVVSALRGLNAEACIYENGELKAKANVDARDEGIKEIKRAVKLSLYKACKNVVNARTAWGILTGVRPAKLVSMLMEQGLDREEISKRLKEDYLVEPQKDVCIVLLHLIPLTNTKIRWICILTALKRKWLIFRNICINSPLKVYT